MAGRIAQVSLFIVALFIGVLLVGQLRSQARPIELSSLSAQELSALIETLSARNVDYSDALADLREQIRDYERAEVEGRSNLELTEEALDQISAFGGLIDVIGQGVAIQIEGSYDATAINDLIHELRNAGAEAIAVDGVRVTASTVAVLGTSSVEIDGAALGNVVEIHAIGSPGGLRSAIERPGGILTVLAQSVDAKFTIETRSNLRLAGTERDLTPQAAQPVE
jgi:uncharacterized protein YlxW (UPF0749 family)